MAITITAYDHLWKLVATGGLDLDTSQIDLRLVTNSYTFSAAHTLWDNGEDDATDPSYNELPTATGYTAGGKTLANPVVTNSTIDFDDVVWTSLTATFRHAIAVGVGTFGGVVNPVLFDINLDTTGDIISTAANYSIIWNATDKVIYRPA